MDSSVIQIEKSASPPSPERRSGLLDHHTRWVHCTDSISMGRLGKGLGGDMSAAVAEGTAKGKTAGWQDQVYDLLRRHNVTQFAYVPDAGHKILIDRSLADPGVQSVALTTEEEGVA